MINKTVDDAVVDAVLAKAFAEAFDRDMAELEKIGLPEREYPRKYLRAERRYYYKRMGILPPGLKKFRRIAACVLICLCVGFAAMMSSPTIRASLWESVVDFYEKYITFGFEADAQKPVVIGDYTMNYVPKGYLLGSERLSRFGGKYRFVNGEGGVFTVSYYVTEKVDIKYDNEDREFQKIIINENEAYFVEYDSQTAAIIWELNGKSFSIVGNLHYEEMRKIAETIS